MYIKNRQGPLHKREKQVRKSLSNSGRDVCWCSPHEDQQNCTIFVSLQQYFLFRSLLEFFPQFSSSFDISHTEIQVYNLFSSSFRSSFNTLYAKLYKFIISSTRYVPRQQLLPSTLFSFFLQWFQRLTKLFHLCSYTLCSFIWSTYHTAFSFIVIASISPTILCTQKTKPLHTFIVLTVITTENYTCPFILFPFPILTHKTKLLSFLSLFSPTIIHLKRIILYFIIFVSPKNTFPSFC